MQTGGALFEQRRDHDHPMLASKGLEGFGAGTGNRLGAGELGIILALAEIGRAKQFLGAEDLGARLNRPRGGGQGFFKIGLGIGQAGRLQ